MLTTASLAVSRQMLQSKFESGPPGAAFEEEVDGPSLFISAEDDEFVLCSFILWNFYSQMRDYLQMLMNKLVKNKKSMMSRLQQVARSERRQV